MKPHSRAPEQADLLRPRLVDMIDPRHELMKLAALIDSAFFEGEWSGFFPSIRLIHRTRTISRVVRWADAVWALKRAPPVVERRLHGPFAGGRRFSSRSAVTRVPSAHAFRAPKGAASDRRPSGDYGSSQCSVTSRGQSADQNGTAAAARISVIRRP